MGQRFFLFARIFFRVLDAIFFSIFNPIRRLWPPSDWPQTDGVITFSPWNDEDSLPLSVHRVTVLFDWVRLFWNDYQSSRFPQGGSTNRKAWWLFRQAGLKTFKRLNFDSSPVAHDPQSRLRLCEEGDARRGWDGSWAYGSGVLWCAGYPAALTADRWKTVDRPSTEWHHACRYFFGRCLDSSRNRDCALKQSWVYIFLIYNQQQDHLVSGWRDVTKGSKTVGGNHHSRIVSIWICITT